MTEEENKNTEEPVSDNDEVTENTPLDESAVHNPFPKTDLFERLSAKFIDFVIAAMLIVYHPLVGVLAAITYILLSDALMNGQSVGKRLIGLKVVNISDGKQGESCDIRRSMIRNAIFAIAMLIYMLVHWIPYLGNLISTLAIVAINAYEIFRLYNDDHGLRLGDILSETAVVKADSK